jgi:hypothetical protein
MARYLADHHVKEAVNNSKEYIPPIFWDISSKKYTRRKKSQH